MRFDELKDRLLGFLFQQNLDIALEEVLLLRTELLIVLKQEIVEPQPNTGQLGKSLIKLSKKSRHVKQLKHLKTGFNAAHGEEHNVIHEAPLQVYIEDLLREEIEEVLLRLLVDLVLYPF